VSNLAGDEGLNNVTTVKCLSLSCFCMIERQLGMKKRVGKVDGFGERGDIA
jgi:hypothetical protein